MFRRLLASWQVLMGSRLTPLQIQSEWIEYKQIFNDQLERLSAYLARAAKAEAQRVRRIEETMAEAAPDRRDVPDPTDRHAMKAYLRRQVAGSRIGLHQEDS